MKRGIPSILRGPRSQKLTETESALCNAGLSREEKGTAGNSPKRKTSRSNTRLRRAQWKASAPALVKTVENGKVVYSRPHQAKVVTDLQGTELFLEYKGRKVAWTPGT